MDKNQIVDRELEKMKIDFPEIWGMTYEEFQRKISTPEMKILVRELRKKFG